MVIVESVEELNQLDVLLTKQEFQVYTAASKAEGTSRKMLSFFHLGVEILLTQSLSNLHTSILKQCKVLVHAQMARSVE